MSEPSTQEIMFDGDGVKLSGRLWRPVEAATPRPVIVLSHGFSALMDMGLGRYAEAFAHAGFVCLAYDHRGYGNSEGWPRLESNPWLQVEDMRAAISFARTLPGVDPERLGLWGVSYAGGHVITVTALDRRVRCAVAQVPLVTGQGNFNAWVPADKRDRFLKRLADDRDARARGVPPTLAKAAYPGSETEEWASTVDTAQIYPNATTLRSLELMRTYEPISFIKRVAPTPFMMIVADRDTQTPVEGQLEAFELAGHPKRLVSLAGRHYDPDMSLRPQSIAAALEWFGEHLSPAR